MERRTELPVVPRADHLSRVEADTPTEVTSRFAAWRTGEAAAEANATSVQSRAKTSIGGTPSVSGAASHSLTSPGLFQEAVNFDQFAGCFKVGSFTDVDAMRERRNKFLFLERKNTAALTNPHPVSVGQYLALQRLCEDWNKSGFVMFGDSAADGFIDLHAVMPLGIAGHDKRIYECNNWVFGNILRDWDSWSEQLDNYTEWGLPEWWLLKRWTSGSVAA